MNQIRTLGSIELQVDCARTVNYASFLNGDKLIKELAVKNIGNDSLTDVKLRFEGYYFTEEEVKLGNIASGETRKVTLSATPQLSLLLTLNEAVYTTFLIVIDSTQGEQARFSLPLTIQAWNHWTASPDAYREVASFVMPNHPYVSSLIEKASGYLQADSNHSDFSGYNVVNYCDVVEYVRAIWSALVSENIKYLTLSPNFVDYGQRVVTPDLVAAHHQGNCLDLTLLLCSCLERIGLSPCLVFVPGHVMTGVWIDPNHGVTDSVITDFNDIKRFALEEEPILMLIESTAMCHGDNLDEAVNSAISQMVYKPVEYVVDVLNARKEGVRSIPVNTMSIPVYEDKTIKGCGTAGSGSTRRHGWERKLLDLTLRNVMLNLKQSKVVVPIGERDTATVVDYVKTGRLAELVGTPGKDNNDQLKELYRAARTALEENGTNSLYVSLGTLRWYDIDDPCPHIAPLLFIPVSIVRKKAMTYEVRMREDDAIINVTLIEMLHQMFGITFEGLESLPENEDGFPDWKRVFGKFRIHVDEINKLQPTDRKWELPVQSYIGIFSFTKFLMWHDIHYHPDVVERHRVLRGLIDNRYQPNTNVVAKDAASIEMDSLSELMLPVDYDSSQLEAVYAAHAGQTFVLHGPPGTGKSQTITNIISNALYSGKKVLFVAEKKAALDVVRSRLNSVGLEPYCLELHSNKTDKRSFFGQVNASGIFNLGDRLNRDECADEYTYTAHILANAQKYLHDFCEAMHSEREYGQSLYLYINNLLACGYNQLALSYSDIKHLTPAKIKELCAEYRSLDFVTEILGYHPGTSPLVGLYPRENTSGNQNSVTEALEKMPDSIARARKKATSFINRLFRKWPAEAFLHEDILWEKLHLLAWIDKDKCENIDTFEKYVTKWGEAVSELRRWYHFSEKAAVIVEYNLPKALEYYLSGAKGDHTADSIYGSYFRTLAYHAIDNDNRLRGFSGRLFEDKLDRYRTTVNEFQGLGKAELLRKLGRQIDNAVLNPEQERQLSVLLRRMQTNGRGVALRKVIEDSSDVLGMLFPCMLMSPLSVAQYLKMTPDQFDIVIFDEASQLETPDAVGAIARGRTLIVVGDTLQLPPTRFFMTQTSTGEEVEESEDSNSIIEDCIALGIPSRYLSRHYRSRHESLIAFSNTHFYGNRLMTFPSRNDQEKKVYFTDPGGVYDYGKTRTNLIEAEAVVKRILEIADQAEVAPSIGVVAFSKAQSTLIEDILNAKLQRNKALQAKLDNASEPLFVKNLENVQGDERDIIIFSIGYGPDKNGNVSQNFGPINQSGGERRLNVAVSRAREQMLVFSSLLPRHIADGSVARGVIALRDFLAYAIDGTLVKDVDTSSEKEAVVEDIAQRLRANGFDVLTKVGRSSFKIDIAVVDAHNKEYYRLGIILDGRDYNNLPTVRDREITVPAILQSLGWTLCRVWVIDWLENPDAVINRISSLLELTPSRELTLPQ